MLPARCGALKRSQAATIYLGVYIKQTGKDTMSAMPWASGVADTVIFRLSRQLARKIRIAPAKVLPPDENPFAVWSAHVFAADPTQYLLLTNTPSLYSTVLYGRGISSDDQFLELSLSQIREFLCDAGQEFIYRRFIAPASAQVSFSKAVGRLVTGSMNDMIVHAQHWLTEGEISPHDASFKLNELPMSALGYQNARERTLSLLEAGRE